MQDKIEETLENLFKPQHKFIKNRKITLGCYTTYATGLSHDSVPSALRVQIVDQINAILRDQFHILPKRRAIGYTKPYPSEYDFIPLCDTQVLSIVTP
jgi:hypothetical protein